MNRVLSVILLLFSLSFLTACDPIGSVMIKADSHSSVDLYSVTENKSLGYIFANGTSDGDPSSTIGQWQNMNTKIAKDQWIKFTVRGETDSCYNTKTYKVYANNEEITYVTTDNLSISLKPENVFKVLSPPAPTINYTGTSTNAVSLTALKNNTTCAFSGKQWRVNAASSESHNACWGTYGMGLEIYIGDVKRYFSNYAFGSYKDILVYNYLYTASSMPDPSTTEGAALASIQSYMPLSNFSGLLGFRIEDSAGDYDDNVGYYDITASVGGCEVSMNANDVVTAATESDSEGCGAVQFVLAADDVNPNSTNEDLTDSTVTISDGYYKAWSSNAGHLWMRMKDCDGDYSNNIGQYQVMFETVRAQKQYFANFLSKIIDPIKKEVDLMSQIFYKNFLGDSRSGTILKAMMTLYVALYGAMYLVGLTQIHQRDLVVRVVKIAFMVTLISDDSWSFFNKYLFTLFREGSDELIISSTGTTSVFGFVDVVLQLFLMPETWYKVIAFMSYLIGFFFLYIFVLSFFMYLWILLEVVLAYSFAYVMIGLLICFAPLFLVMILFERTKSMFDNWVKYIFNYALQPVMIIATVIIMNQLIVTFFVSMMSFSATWECVLPVYVDFSFLLKALKYFIPDSDSLKVDLFCIKWYNLSDYSVLVSSLAKSVIFYLLIVLLKKLIDYVPLITDSLTTVAPNTGTAVSGKISSSPAGDVIGAMQRYLGIDEATKQERKNNEKEEKDKVARIKQLGGTAKQDGGDKNTPPTNNSNSSVTGGSI